MIYRLLLGGLAAAGLAHPACAYDVKAKVALDPLITRHAKANDVPPALVHRIILRESRYNARAVGRGGTMGLMQIKHGTARALGYTGAPEGLLDPDTNLTFGVRYLAGAYRVANGDQNRAVGYFARGYYYDAKRRGLHRGLAQRPVAAEEQQAAAPAPAPPAQPPSLFALIFAPTAQSPQEMAPAVEQPAVEEQPAPAPSAKRRRRAAAAHADAADQVAGTGAPERPAQRRRASAVAAPAIAAVPAAGRAGADDARMIAEETAGAVRRDVRPSRRAGGADANRSGRKASAQPDDPGRSP
jgi:hypothetical protein